MLSTVTSAIKELVSSTVTISIYFSLFQLFSTTPVISQAMISRVIIVSIEYVVACLYLPMERLSTSSLLGRAHSQLQKNMRIVNLSK